MTLRAHVQLEHGDFSLDAEINAPVGVTVLFGPSASGKTSLLRGIAGLEPDITAAISLNGTDWHTPHDGCATPVHERGIGYVFQNPLLFSHLDVRGNLEYGMHRATGRPQRIQFEEALRITAVNHLLDRSTRHLSGGEQQRVALARALLCQPDLLLLDEPLAALDVDARRSLLPAIDACHRMLDIPVIYVTHAVDELARLADHIVLLDSGRVRAAGPAQTILTHLDLPVACFADARSAIDAVADEAGYAGHIQRFTFPGGTLLATCPEPLPSGVRVRLTIRASDVSLCLERPSDTSILNVLAASVEELKDASPGITVVRINAGGTPFLARITTRSAQALALAPGMAVFAQIKSVAVLASSSPV